jgi:hyperosmotically inducible periplasmic protein
MPKQKDLILAIATVLLSAMLAATTSGEAQRQSRDTNPENGSTTPAREDEAADEKAPEAADGTDSPLRSAWLKGKLEMVILLNRHLNNFTIDSEVTDGTATLKGEVESEVDRELAEQLALSIDGIEAVDNQLTVAVKTTEEKSSDSSADPQKAAARLEDATLLADVKDNFRSHGSTRELDIDVTVKDRKIILRGTVGSAAEKDLAGMLAAGVEGVDDVDNQLVVSKLKKK